mgnify:CR=1 FL=1
MKVFLSSLAAVGLCVFATVLTPAQTFAASAGDIVKTPTTVLASSIRTTAKDQISAGVQNAGGDSNGISIDTAIKSIVNIMLFLLGAIAVIMIVIGGIRYTTSNGDSNSINSAKNTILYAVIGLVVAILAFAIVNFILDAI